MADIPPPENMKYPSANAISQIRHMTYILQCIRHATKPGVTTYIFSLVIKTEHASAWCALSRFYCPFLLWLAHFDWKQELFFFFFFNVCFEWYLVSICKPELRNGAASLYDVGHVRNPSPNLQLCIFQYSWIALEVCASNPREGSRSSSSTSGYSYWVRICPF